MKSLFSLLLFFALSFSSFAATQEKLVVLNESKQSTADLNKLLDEGWKVKHLATTHARPGNMNSLFITVVLERELPPAKSELVEKK